MPEATIAHIEALTRDMETCADVARRERLAARIFKICSRWHR